MKPAISTHMFAFGKLTEAHLALLLEFGFDRIELWGMRPHVDWYDKTQVKRFSDRIQKTGMAVATIHLPFYNIFGDPDFHYLYFNNPDKAIREEAFDRACHLVDLCPDFGCDTVVLHGNGSQKENDAKADGDYRAMLDRFLPYCQKRGVRIAIENIMTPMSSTPVLRKLVDEYDSDHLGLCLDTGHANISEDVLSAIKNCGPRLFTTHIADNYGKNDDHIVPFSGTIDWPPSYQAFLEHCPNLTNFLFELMYPVLNDSDDLTPYRQLLDDARSAWKKLHNDQ